MYGNTALLFMGQHVYLAVYIYTASILCAALLINVHLHKYLKLQHNILFHHFFQLDSALAGVTSSLHTKGC